MKVSLLKTSERAEMVAALVAADLRHGDQRPGLDTEQSLTYYYRVLDDEVLYIKYRELLTASEVM